MSKKGLLKTNVEEKKKGHLELSNNESTEKATQNFRDDESKFP